MGRGAGGPPNGTYVLTSEGNEQHYAVQVLSRFVLAYKLAVESAPVVTKGVMSIMAPGYRQPVVDYDDLDLRISNQKGAYGILRCLSRDSVVVDTFTEVCFIFSFLKSCPSHTGCWLVAGTFTSCTQRCLHPRLPGARQDQQFAQFRNAVVLRGSRSHIPCHCRRHNLVLRRGPLLPASSS